MEKKTFRMPTAYTILFLLIILVAVATWFIPAGAYDYVDGVPAAGSYHGVEQNPQGAGAVLTAGGSSFENAVKTTCFLADMADFAVFNEVYATYFTTNPARSCVAVKTLPKGVLVEVEVVALVE